MTIIQAVVLGVVQGLTEFLPVSSSAHLAIIQNLFGLHGQVLMVFDVVVHLGTLSALLIYFRKDLFPFPKITPRYVGLIILATIPTALIGFGIKDWMEQYFDVMWVVALTLLINSFILLSTWWAPRYDKKEESTWKDAVWIGIAQGISILPGISRSGATVTMALWLKIKTEEAVRFSFLIAIPAILGAAVLVLPDALPAVSPEMGPVMAAGFISAFLSGYFAIYVLFQVTLRGRFHYFAFYTFLLAAVSFIYQFFQ
jgi:undecaprenyl-diphosphatase